MSILFLENKKIFEKWGSKTYEYKYNSLQQSKHFHVIDMDDNLDNLDLNNYTWVIFGWHGIPINKFYNEPKYDFYKKKIEKLETSEIITNKIAHLHNHENKAILVQDMHSHDYQGGLDNFCNYVNKYNIKKVISPYLKTNMINYIKNKCNNITICHLPHHIDNEKFCDRKLKKNIDILLFGNDHIKFYPFRNRIIKLLLNNKDKFKIHHIPKQTNYFKYNPNTSDENLSKLIKRSWLTLCTPSKFDFLLGKYIETSMSGSVVLGPMPKDGINIWENNYINITDSMSDEEIIEFIKTNLNDKQRLTDIKIKMLEKMNEYTLAIYPNKLNNIINQ